MKKTVWIMSCSIGICLLACTPSLLAQAVGSITGTVTDPSGGVVPGAKVTATRIETGVSQYTVTSGAGIYTIQNLVVGNYNVTADATGFKAGTASNVTLDVSQQREVNFTLALSGVTSQVKVTAAPPLLNTTNGTLGGLVNAEQVQDLPLNGRDITGLVYLQPGVVSNTGGMGWMDNQGQWISNGNRGETMTGTLDEGDISDAEMGTLQFTNFNLDAIAEFKVQQNNYSAQYGQGSGSITQMVSKSGTNEFHGSLFEFLRNSAFDARNFFATGPGVAGGVPPFRRNEFGGTFGGPIKKDKTFFFVEYAGFRQRLGEPNIVAVPTPAEKAGMVTIPDPVTGNSDTLQVPLNPVAASILSKYPDPNQPNGLLGPNTFNYVFSQPTNDDQWSARLDHHFSSKDSLFARASWVNNIAKETDSWAAELGGAGFATSNVGEARNYTLSETHLFSPTLLNDFTFTLNRGIEGVPEAPAEFNTTNTQFEDGSLQGWGPDTFETKYVTTVFEYKDNVAWTRGRQSFNIGGNFRREWDNGTGVTSYGPSGQFNFNAGTTLPQAIPSISGGTSLPAGSPSPSGLISMMEGAVDYYARSVAATGYGPPGGGFTWWGLRRSMMAGYIQDDWKVNQKLTLNLGLRYEYDTVPWEVGDRLSLPAESGALYGHFIVNPQPLWKPDRIGGDFGPRLGLAYNMGHNTVLRGGLGIFTNTIPTVYPDQSLVDFPVASLSVLPSATYSLSPLPVSLPVLTSTSGQPLAADGNTKSVPPNTPINFAPFAAITGPLIGDFPSDTMRNGYTISGNFTLEHQFAGGIEAQASYVANDGVSLYTQDYPNAMYGAEPQYTPFTTITPGMSELQVFHNGAHSAYNALQAQVQKNSAAHGIEFQANYTYAKDMTDADAVWSSGGQNGAIMENNPTCRKCEYAQASYSVAQRFVANFEYSPPLARFSGLPDRLTHGWKILGIFQAQSGLPFTVVTPYGSVQYGFDAYDGIGVRPFLLQRATRSSVLQAGCGPQFFSNAVIGMDPATCSGPGGGPLEGVGTGYFGMPLVTSPVAGIGAAQAAPGNLGRNTFTGPGWSNFDFSIIKDTRLTETKTLQFRAEFFNILNQATFGNPGATLGSSGFGVITYTATAERQIQFGLRLMF
ncbi:MAG TPA: TonB-dependent receptor [Terriglobia bacterium]|nr:TonB-dependent receptor [Terriglobia bacterium]